MPDADRFSHTSQAVNDLVLALDAGAAPSGPDGSYVRAGRRVLSGWVIALLAVALLVPPGLVAIDLTGRALREGLPLRDELLRIVRLALPLAGAALGALVAGLTGLAPSSPGRVPVSRRGKRRRGRGRAARDRRVRRRRRRRTACCPVARAAPVDPAFRAAVAITAALICGCAGAALATAALPVAGLLLMPALHVWTMLERVTRGGAVVRGLAILLPLVLPALLIARGASLDTGEAVRLITDGRMPIGAAIGAALTLAVGGVLAARFIVPQRDVA